MAVRHEEPEQPRRARCANVILNGYEVQYFSRTDGRGMEGVDVPYRITGNLTRDRRRGERGRRPSPSTSSGSRPRWSLPSATSRAFRSCEMMARRDRVRRDRFAARACRLPGAAAIDFADYGDRDADLRSRQLGDVAMRVSHYREPGFRPCSRSSAPSPCWPQAAASTRLREPPVDGPSDTGVSVQLTALPDMLNADGVSQAVGAAGAAERRTGRPSAASPCYFSTNGDGTLVPSASSTYVGPVQTRPRHGDRHATGWRTSCTWRAPASGR